MWEISNVSAINWTKLDTGNVFAPRNMDVECPNPVCRRSLINIRLS